MPTYKLYYFNGRGRAELSRLLFALAGQEFEDVRMEMTGEPWQKLKPKAPTGQVPMLEVDGRMFSQSFAIATFLAREFGFYGKTNLECLRIDEINGIIADFLNEGVKAFFAEESKKEELMKQFKETKAPKFLTALTNKLKENGKDHFVGSSVTLADVAVYDTCYNMTKRIADILDKFPELQAHVKRIGNLDKIKKYVAKRPETSF